MKQSLILTPQAEHDVAEAFDYYEGKKEHLGFEFVTEVDRAIQRIAEHPLSHRKVIGDARRALVDRFPYGIWFIVDPEDGSIVIACLHHSRDLKHVRKRLFGSKPENPTL